MTGNPSGPMNLAENPLPRSHAHGRRHEAQLIAEMTRVSLNEMRQLDWWNEAQEREEKDHLLWIFNVYSGVSHGMSWHELMHSTLR